MFASGFRDKQQVKPTLRDLQSRSGSNLSPAPIPAFSAEPVRSPQPTLLDMSPAHTETPAPPPQVALTDVFVPLESIKPSKWAAVPGAVAQMQMQADPSLLCPCR